MPNLFPALLSATVLCTIIPHFNEAIAQTINGTVGQQVVGAGSNVQITSSGTIQVTDQTGLMGNGSSISIQNFGSIDIDIANNTPGPVHGIDINGDNANVDNIGQISAGLFDSVVGSNIGPYSTLAINGNDGQLSNSGTILSYIDAVPTVAGTSLCATPIIQNEFCIGTANITASQATIPLSGSVLTGDRMIIENSGLMSTLVSRAVTGEVSTLSIVGDNSEINNSGTIELIVADSTLEIFQTGFLFPNDWDATRAASAGTLTPNGFVKSAISIDGDHAQIVNTGTIRSHDFETTDTSIGIDAYTKGALGAQIQNDGLITATGFGVMLNSGTLINNGVMDEIANGRTNTPFFESPEFTYTTSGSGGQPNLTQGLVVATRSTIVNNGEINFTVDGIGIENPLSLATTGGMSRIENNGVIRNKTSSTASNGINLSRESAIVYNNGYIEAGLGIRASRADLDLINNGNIMAYFAGVSTTGQGNISISNSGRIFGEFFGVTSANVASSVDGLSIDNTGAIFGETGIETAFAALDLVNSGSIFSTIGPAGYAIITQSIGGNFGFDSDDSIKFEAGTRIIGRMDLGPDPFMFGFSNGNDTITLDRTSPDIAWRWTFDNFDIPGQDPIDQSSFSDSLFILGNNVPYYIWNGPVTGDFGPFPSEGGITVYIPNISGIFAANGIMEDIARTVHGGIRNRLNEGWDYENLPQDLFYRSEDDIVLRDGSDLIGAPLEALDPAVFRKAPPLTVWAKGFGGIRNEAGTASYGDYSHLWMGGMAGLDLRSSQGDENDDGLRDTEDDDHWNIGVLGGYVQSDLSFASGFKDIQSDFFFAGAYGRLVRDALYLDASIIGGFGGMSEYGPIANNLVPGGIENPGEGYSTDGHFISPSASIGKRFYITDTISFSPEVNATYLAQWIDGSTSPLTLSIEDRFIDTVFGHVQGSVKKVIKRDNSTIIGELRGGLYMSRQLHGDETNLSVVSNQFTIDTSREDIVSPYVGIGATWEIADNFKLSADGEMDFGDLDGGRTRFGASLSF